MNKKTQLPKLVSLLTLSIVVAICSGCGSKSDVNWIGNPNRDWVKSVSGRGLANVWGVIFDVEKIEGEVGATATGTFGATPQETNATNEIKFGDVVILLESTNTKKFKLSVNGKNFGTVRKGHRVLIDTDRNVYVNDELREPQE